MSRLDKPLENEAQERKAQKLAKDIVNKRYPWGCGEKEKKIALKVSRKLLDTK